MHEARSPYSLKSYREHYSKINSPMSEINLVKKNEIITATDILQIMFSM